MKFKYPEELKAGELIRHPRLPLKGEFVELITKPRLTLVVRNIQNCSLDSWKIEANDRIAIDESKCRCVRLPGGMGYGLVTDAA